MKLFSADSHVIEPPEVWENILSFKPKEPDPYAIGYTDNPVIRLFDQDADSIGIEVLYPTTARNFYCIQDDDKRVSALAHYNDWLSGYCAQAPDRLLGLGVLSALDIEWSLQEMRRCVALGFHGALLPSMLPAGVCYDVNYFSPLWNLAQEINFPMHFHIHIVQILKPKSEDPLRSIGGGVRELIVQLQRVVERYPRLRVVLAEYDDVAEMHPLVENYPQIYVTFQNRCGSDNARDRYMWASDYPHIGTTWPRSQESAAKYPRQLIWDNAARFYGTAPS